MFESIRHRARHGATSSRPPPAAVGRLAGGSEIPGAFAQGSDAIRIGLIGCGGRGTGAVADALSGLAGCHARRDGRRLQGPRSRPQQLREQHGAKSPAVKPEHGFTGFDAYQKVLAVPEVNYIILATPPGFRPMHLKAAVAPASTSSPRSRWRSTARDPHGAGACQGSRSQGPRHRRRHAAAAPERLPRDDEAHPRRRHRRHRRRARTGTRAACGSATPAGMERHGVAAAQLAVLHLAVRRPHRRAARPQHRRDQLGHAGAPGAAPSAWAGGRSAPTRSSATSSTTSRSTTSIPTARTSMSMCRQIDGCANSVSEALRRHEGHVPGRTSTRSRAPRRGSSGSIRSARTCRSTST